MVRVSERSEGMIVETRDLWTIEVFDFRMFVVGLSVCQRAGVANPSNTDGRKYLDMGNLQWVDVGIGLPSTGIVGGEG